MKTLNVYILNKFSYRFEKCIKTAQNLKRTATKTDKVMRQPRNHNGLNPKLSQLVYVYIGDSEVT